MDCPLELKSFSIPDPKSQFIALERLQGNGEGDLLLTLKNLKKDLHDIWLSNDGRIAQLQTELSKADTYIKTRMKDIKQLGSDPPVSVPQVLKLKISAQAAAESANRKLSGDRQNKRKRSRVNMAETDDDEVVVVSKPSQATSQRRASAMREENNDANEGEAQKIEDKKVKTSSQSIQVETFWKHVEQYFRPITEVDIKALYMVDPDDPTPYIVPSLGKDYHLVWEDEERNMLSTTQLAGDTQEAYCGTLTERILSSLLDEEIVQAPGLLAVSESGESVVSHHHTQRLRSHTADELYCVEERIRLELQQLGLFENDDMQVDQDEITLELRRLQTELTRVSEINQARYRVIAELAQQKMAYQEYQSVLEELNTQVEAHYQKKYKAGVSKIKNRRQTFPGLASRPSNEALQNLLIKRKQLIEEIEPLFSPSITDVPSQTIFEDEEFQVKEDVTKIVVVPDNGAIEQYRRLLKPATPSPVASVQNSAPDLSALPVGIIKPSATQSQQAGKKKPRKQKDTGSKEPKKPKKPRVKKDSSKAASVTSSQDLSGTINPAALLGDDFSITGLPDWMLQQ